MDPSRIALLSVVAGLLAALVRYWISRLLGHTLPFSDLLVGGIFTVVFTFLGERYVRPWLARLRDADDERRTALDHWRLD